MATEKFTGKIRYRVQPRFFSKDLVVLQVEIKVEYHRIMLNPYTIPKEDRVTENVSSHTYWRDAQSEDLAEVYSKQLGGK